MDSIIIWINDASEKWFQFFFNTSIQLTIFILLIFGLSILFRNRSSKFLFGLWSLVLLKAFIPPSVIFPSQPEFIPQVTLPLFLFENSNNEFVISGPTFSFVSYLLLTWLFVAGALLIFIVAKNLVFKQKIRNAIPVDNEDLPFSIRSQFEKNRIAVFRSKFKHSPFTWNFIRPKIYLPKDSYSWDQEQLEAILLHEMAHIKRGDLWLNLLQTFIQIIYFFQPFVWFANWQLGYLKERACDDYVVSKSSNNALSYSKILLSQIDNIKQLHKISPMVNYFHQNRWSIMKRFEYLINRKEKIMLRLKTNEIVILSFICCFALLLSFLNCGDSETVTAPPPASEKLVMEKKKQIEFAKFDIAPKPIGGMAAIQNNLEYPDIARRAGIQGLVIVTIHIDTLGNVTDSKILKSLGNNGCGEAARAALTKTKWEPAQFKGKPINVWVNAPVTFKLKEQAASMGKINGTIIDNSTGQPIKGALVFVESNRSILQSYTNESGKFTITNVPPGEHKLICGIPNMEKQKAYFAKLEELRKNKSDEVEYNKFFMEGRAKGKEMGLEIVAIRTLTLKKDQVYSINFSLKE